MKDSESYRDGQAGGGGFNTTHWSVVLLAGQGESPQATTALETLCRVYWYPLYAFARRQGIWPEEGRDLTQQFFAGFLEKKYFSQADPTRGRFRSFLLASFKHFLANEYNRSQAIKRGGQCAFVSWDAADTEERYAREPASEATPDRLFDQAWVLTLLEKVMNELRDDYVRAGKGNVFEALQAFLTGNKSEATYAEIGVALGMGESAVKMAVLRLRQRYGEKLRNEVAHTLRAPGDVEDELRHLMSALSR